VQSSNTANRVLVQIQFSVLGSGPVTTSFTTNVSAGHSIEVFVAANSGAGTCTATSTPSNTFTLVATSAGSGGELTAVLVAIDVAANTNSIVVNCWGVYEYYAIHDVSGVSGIDQSYTNPGSSATPSCTTGSLTSNIEYVAGFAMDWNNIIHGRQEVDTHLRPSRPTLSTLPSPIQPNFLAVPGNHRLRLDDGEGRAPT